MRLGLAGGYAGMGMGEDLLELVQEADRLGYASVWVAEAYGSDSPTVLGWLAAQTEHIGLGAGVMQIPARTPAMTAMTAATLDTLSHGRFLLGLGVSGPQVSEGWHGVRFEDPLGRTREYVEIVRSALRREAVAHDGEHFTLPLPDGPGKSLRLTIHPPRPDLPIYLAAVGPRNLRLAGEVADGWLAIFLSPEHSADLVATVREGRERSGRGTPQDPMAGFDTVATVPVVVTDDLEAARATVAPYAALYIGGMGSREKNFYNDLAVRMGYADEAKRVQDFYLDKQYREAMAALPLEFVDRTSLLGPKERIADKLVEYAEAGVTTLAITPFGGGPGLTPYDSSVEARIAVVRTVAEALDHAGIGD